MTRLCKWFTFSPTKIKDVSGVWHLADHAHTLCGTIIPKNAIVKDGPVSSCDCNDCLLAFNQKNSPAKQEAML